MNPRPCPHPVHLACLAATHDNAKDFACFRCVPLVSIMRRIGGVNAGIDLKEETLKRIEKKPVKEALDASDSAKLKRMLEADGYQYQIEASKIKCVTLVHSADSEKLLDAEYSRTKLVW